mmetsp:Transcript_31548/g.66369  ORF Transcript_31548/g.66369 Transcript_31548/m.66369 type:complete len:372 (-) Transcript_31548:75-1190(-)|eukprot:CAMPEP_0172326118 /NCGR_PEP_ID=MMETSP1058-20130122/55636_1 /TAXON_ID=83371 /ORGANISM="Detonula confervacea, Strain CCMP 353" /LENGTH=371 /DNA_ID=CAMNT_0013042825 /DNA_START=258 /DNA_END=1373 /DNA_ORIENTATION=+
MSNATTLDLHGRRLEDAISEVTLFLDRIRRTVAASSMGRSGGQHVLFVQIITGSGSHSSHGPILRSAVQKLLEKRGMTFTLQRGGGAFQVDSLSGRDLYDPGLATDSKVLVAEQDEFHQLASLRRRNTAGNMAHASMAQCTANSGPHRRVLVPSSSFHHSNSDPLPSQVASEDAGLRNATELSIGDSQQQHNRQKRMNKEYERQFDRAVSESQLDQTTPRRSEAKEEEEKLQLKLAYEQSVIDEQHRQHLTEKQYENTIMIAMEESTQEANRQKSSEDDLVQQALAESMALAQAEKANNSEDDLFEMALAESLLEEEKRIAHHQGQEALATSHGVNILEEVKRLSLKQEKEEAIREEEAIKKIIEMSKHMR